MDQATESAVSNRVATVTVQNPLFGEVNMFLYHSISGLVCEVNNIKKYKNDFVEIKRM